MESRRHLIRNFLWLLFYCFIFVLLLRHSFSYLDPDFGWHLRLGQEIYLNSAVPSVNYDNYTLFGQSFVDHEWLSNLGLYWSYTNFSYLTLNVFFSLLIVLLFFLLNRFFIPRDFRNKNFWLLFVFEIMGLLLIVPHSGIRVQEITLVCFALLLIILNAYQRRRHFWTLLWLLPLFILWTNLHGGFLFGLFVLAAFLAIKIIETTKLARRFHFLDLSSRLKNPEIWILAVFLLASIASTLVTPYGLKLYSFLFSYSDTFYLTHIQEWMPQWSYPYQYWQFSFLSIFLVLFFLHLVSVIKKKNGRKVNLWPLCLMALTFLMAVKSRRNFPLFFIASFPFALNYLLEALGIGEKQALSLEAARAKKNKSVFILIDIFLGLTIAAALLNITLSTHIVKQPFNDFCEDSRPQNTKKSLLYPCAATRFLIDHPELENRRLLNEFGWGGYLLWNYPGRQLFIDGRMPQAQYGEHSILEEYFAFLGEDQNKSVAKLQEHKIDLILWRVQPSKRNISFFEKRALLINEKEVNKDRDYLRMFLSTSPEWEKIYSDQVAEIYKRLP